MTAATPTTQPPAIIRSGTAESCLINCGSKEKVMGMWIWPAGRYATVVNGLRTS